MACGSPTVSSGRGRPLILIHGYLSTAMAMAVIAGKIAGRGYRVILPDLRGHGESARPHDPAAYPPDALADDGLALVEHLGLSHYDLAGYSLGGRTVIRMLARGATPGRAIAGGQGLEAITHTAGRGGQYRHVLTHFGTFEPGSPEQAMATTLPPGPWPMPCPTGSTSNCRATTEPPSPHRSSRPRWSASWTAGRRLGELG